ncbi:MAG: hypothetical protein RUMPE_00650 [Eubacteriales bacterium SKADARSKE-1]|nr:hypothetical protein [Eubacteriales bacterium SKADARSKE-1]
MSKKQKPKKEDFQGQNGYKKQEFSISSEKQIKLYCLLSYIYILWIVGLLAENKNPKVRFHVNQGIILSIFSFSSLFVIQLLSAILFFIAPILTFFSAFFQIAWIIIFVTFVVIGIKNAIKGCEEPLPFIGDLFIILR